ncbi:MAG: helicase-associated domain-containing protein, partial [Frankia sp.]|nr:helicase-associated domain-containing protein [Frankia sp.]
MATPPPPDFDILAARVEIRVSVVRALEGLDLFTSEVAAALTLLPAPVPIGRLAGFCGGLDVSAAVRALRARCLVWGPDEALRVIPSVSDAFGHRPLGLGRPVRDCLAGHRAPQLARLYAALARPLAGITDPASGVADNGHAGGPGATAGGDEGTNPSVAPGLAGGLAELARTAGAIRAAAGQGLSPRPAPAADRTPPRELLINAIATALADRELVELLAAECSPAARQILDRLLDAGSPLGSTAEAERLCAPQDASTPVEELLARGLLIGVDSHEVELPREVGLALRGARPAGRLHPEPPALTGRSVDPGSVDPAAALAAETIARQVTTLLDAWGATPVVPLRTGGISVRDLRAAARLLDVPERVAAFVIELADAAGLVGRTDSADTRVVPTTAYDRWLLAEPADRWAALVAGWAWAATVSSLVGERDARGKQIAALSLEVRRPAAATLRHLVLTALAAAPEGVAPSPDAVRALIAWRAPRRAGPLLDRLVEDTLFEAELLGLTGRGVPAATGRALASHLAPEDATAGWASGPDALVDLLARTLTPLLPEPVEELLLQADLTAVAPGPLAPWVAGEIAELADVESTGGATVYRFSEASLRRALDAGRTAAEIHELLGRLARSGVPQALRYLIDDTARRHGLLRVGPAESYLRCDDPALLAEVVSARATQGLGLRQIAPTVVISPLPAAQLLDGLRAAGYAPAGEGAD